MKVPEGVTIIETPTSRWWVEDGIVCAEGRDMNIPETAQQQEERIAFFEKHVAGKKVCMLLDIKNSRIDKQDKLYRTMLAKSFNKIVQAMAIIAPTPMSKMMAHLFFDLQPPTYPYRIFEREEEARAWIKSVCK